MQGGNDKSDGESEVPDSAIRARPRVGEDCPAPGRLLRKATSDELFPKIVYLTHLRTKR